MTDRPNVILSSCHDLGQHLGCYGIETVGTPHIDRLAAEGVRFRRSFCVAPQCSPSRAAIATGRYPHSNGVLGLCHAGFKWDLHGDETHLVRRFADAGYRTALLGIQHETPHPERMGYDEILSDEGGTDPAWGMRLARRGARWLAEAAGGERPLFLQFGLFEPHRAHGHPTQWMPTHRPAQRPATIPPYLEPNQGAADELAFFEASVRTADDAVGHLVAALEAAGLGDRTLVIFTADHGIPFPRAKCSLYDPGLEVPLVMRWPRGPWQAGTVHEAMVSNVDYVPTLCELLDLPPAESAQGRSFAPLLRGEPYEPRHEVFAEMTYHDYYDPVRAVRTETHKLIVSFCYNKALMDPTQQWWHKTITRVPPDPHAARHPLVEFYDLSTDPLEHHNLADEPDHSALRRELLAQLHEWMTATDDPLLEGIPMSPTHHEALAALRQASASQKQAFND